jgi:hypothetical protein
LSKIPSNVLETALNFRSPKDIDQQEAPLNIAKSEHFQETLLAQYRELIQEAILESETEHKTRMDLGKLNSKLQVICKAAQYDGLNETIINEMIDQAIPSTPIVHAA